MDNWLDLAIALADNPFSRASTSQLWWRLSKVTPAMGNRLHEAACEGNLEAVLDILSSTKELDLDEIDGKGKAAIHHALRAGSPEIVRVLLEAGAAPNPASLPPPSLADFLIIVSRILGAVAQWLLLVWIVSALGLPMPTAIRHRAKPLTLKLGVGATISYILGRLWAGGAFRHFQHDTAAEAATSFKGESEDAVLMLLDFGYGPSYFDKLVLWEGAVVKGQTRVCQRLIHMGWQVDTPFAVNNYPEPVILTGLLYASGASHSELVSLLLSHGADATQLDSRGWSCLQLACSEWFRSAKKRTAAEADETLKALLMTDAVQHVNKNHFPKRTDGTESVFQMTWGWPLAEACRGLRPTAVRLLLDAGADPNFADERGVTALHIAAGVCHKDQYTDSLRFLLASGANVNANTTHFWTPLGLVCNWGVSPQALTLLLDAGAETGFGAGRNTPLQIGTRHDVSDGELVQILVERGVDVNATGGTFGSALVAALNKPSGPDTEDVVLKLVSLLIEHGAEVNLAPDGYREPITAAATSNWPRVVQLLINQGATIPPTKELDLSEYKPHWPRAILNVSILSYLTGFHAGLFGPLLEHGAMPNDDAFEVGAGATILGFACTFTDGNPARLLLDYGADPNAIDCRGRHPLHLAAFGLRPEQTKLLLQYGATLDHTCHKKYGTPWHSLCKRVSKPELSLSTEAEDFTRIAELLASCRDPWEMIWTYDAEGKTCLHHLIALSEPSYLVLSLDGPLEAGTSSAVDFIRQFLDRYCRGIHPSVFLAQDSDGQTVFHIAAKLGDVDVMAVLMEHIRSLADEDSVGEDAATIVAALLEWQDNKGRTPLVLAAGHGRSLACGALADVFVSLGLPSDALADLLRPAIEAAIENEEEELAEYLATIGDTSWIDTERNGKARGAVLKSIRLEFSDEMLVDAIRDIRGIVDDRGAGGES